MNLDTYNNEFTKLRAQADKVGGLFFGTKKELEIKLTEISVEAVKLYSANNNYGRDDYGLRVQTFLDFDNYLKAIKKSYKTPPLFFSGADPDENAALLNIKEPSPAAGRRSQGR